MSDKEQRIIIAVAELSLLEGGADKIYPCMTRQEAINKIRIAMHKVFIKQEQAGPLFLNYAEAALNALLGVDK